MKLNRREAIAAAFACAAAPLPVCEPVVAAHRYIPIDSLSFDLGHADSYSISMWIIRKPDGTIETHMVEPEDWHGNVHGAPFCTRVSKDEWILDSRITV